MKHLLTLVLALLFSADLMASAEVVEFSDESLRARYQQLIQELRCPKCQNQSLADSNSPISQDLRAQVQQLLEEGMTDKEIKEYLKARYSEFILYRPEVNQNTWLLWAAPILFVICGLWVIYYLYFRRVTAASGPELAPHIEVAPPAQSTPELSPADQQRLQQLLKRNNQ
jgi:cytochrome c-type biogenesis protein CcmH